MKAAVLTDRGVIKVAGEDARKFLDGLVTTDIGRVAPGVARFGALLTPQGKITADFLVTERPAGDGGGFLIDCDATLAQALTTKLGFYKLRAKVAVENVSDSLGVLAIWGGAPTPMPDLAFPDPRDPALGLRALAPPDLAGEIATRSSADLVDASAYDAHRIACGVPRGGVDFLYGDAFPHETNMDRLHGVDFDKGCYVGQEVVSRMQHRGAVRTRIVSVAFDAPPAQGAAITAAGKPLGTMGSSTAHRGLALLRIDRVADALDANTPIEAGGVVIRIGDPAAVRLPQKQTVA